MMHLNQTNQMSFNRLKNVHNISTKAGLSTTVSTNANGYKLSEDQMDFYSNNGYLVINKLFDTPALDSFRTRFTQLCEGTVGNKHVSYVKDRSLYEEGLKAEYYINKIQDLFYDEVYTTYIEDLRLLDIISQLIGDEVTAINSMFINKPPGTIEHRSHQDLIYLPIRPANKIIGVWTAIDPAKIDNGCLYVIPGSHKAELLYNHVDVESKNKLLFHGIQREEYIAPREKWVYIEMEPGDTLIFNPYLVHGSGANNTQYFRKALTCHYVNSMCHYVDVTGTCQEEIKTIAEAEIKRLGGEFSFIDLWRVKSKKLRGVKSNL